MSPQRWSVSLRAKTFDVSLAATGFGGEATPGRCRLYGRRAVGQWWPTWLPPLAIPLVGLLRLVRRIAALALPALGVFAAELIYLLFDTAVVGRLGALSLAGLAVGGLLVAMVSTQLTFLSYGTTARSARFHGAGDRRAAVREGVQATWLAIGLGLMMVVIVQAIARATGLGHRR